MKKNKKFLALFLAMSMMLQGIGVSTVSAAEPAEAKAETAVVPGTGGAMWEPNLKKLEKEFDLYEGSKKGTISADKNGVVRIDGGQGNKAVSKDQAFDNFVFETDMTIEKQANLSDKSSAQGGVLFRVSKATDKVANGFHGYYFALDAVNGQAVLGLSTGTDWKEIATKKMIVNYGVTYHVTITASDDHIVCYVNYDGTNYAKIDVVDDTHAKGGFGMRNWLSHVSYANMVVSEYNEETLSEEESYTNPLLPNVADPDVLYYNGTYYLYPTNAGSDDTGIKVYTSTDLVNWTEQGWALRKEDSWQRPGVSFYDFWAPDVIERDGKFYMYYVACEQLCLATSDSPLGPFKQEVKEAMDIGDKNIDAHVFYDEPSGKYYIYYVRFDGGNTIYGAELDDDMKTIKKETITKVVNPFDNANDGDWDAGINEGPFMLVHEGKYYLTYSGNNFVSPNYGSAYAVGDSPLGPFEKYSKNPIMQSNTLAHGTGHHGVTYSPDGTEMFLVYHRHYDLSTTEPRKFCIDRLQFTTDENGETVLEAYGPTVTPQALPSGAVTCENYIEADAIDTILVDADADAEAVKKALPSSVAIRTSKTTLSGIHASKKGDPVTRTADIVWDLKDYKAQPDGTAVEVKGKLTLPKGVENLGDIDLTITAEVISGSATKVEVQRLVDSIEIPYADGIRGNITLPEEKDGVALSWKSHNTDVITDEVQENLDESGKKFYWDIPAGVVTRQEKDTDVTLTVTATKDDVSISRDITVKVLAAPKAIEEEDYAGYLYAHFKEFGGEIGEQDVFYGISEDGLNWTALNDNEKITESTLGDNATRDPFIIRSPEGDKFYLVATDQDIYKFFNSGSDSYGAVNWGLLTSVGSTNLVVMESTDLVNWTDQRLLNVAGSLNAGNAYAPEVSYDEMTGEYLIYWASRLKDKNGNLTEQRTFVSRTRDFYSFTEPEIFNDFPLNNGNIDTSILKVEKDGKTQYYRVIKNEAGQYVQLHVADNYLRDYKGQTTTTINGKTYNMVGNHYKYIKNTASGCLETFKGYYEGATMFKFIGNSKYAGQYCVMVDEYGGATRGYIPFVTDDLSKPNSVKPLADSEYVPQEACKHGVMLPVTQEEMDRLNKAYGVDDGALASMDKQDTPVVTFDFENAEAGAETIVPAGAENLVMSLFGNAAVKTDADTDSKVLYLDGKDTTYASLPQGMFDNMKELTISMDVKPEIASTHHQDFVIGKDKKQYFYLRFRDKEITAGLTASGNTREKTITTAYGGALNSWVHVDVTINNFDMAFYVNGSLVGTQRTRNITELGRNLSSYFGKAFFDDPNFKGSFDNVKIYNKALTMEELEAGKMTGLTTKYEAEDAELTGAAKVADANTASGGKKVGYIDPVNGVPSTVTFKVNVDKADTYKVGINIIGGWANAAHAYYVNGDAANKKVIQYTGAKTGEYFVEVDFEEGENTFTIAYTEGNDTFTELDYITLYKVSPKAELVAGDIAVDFDESVVTYDVDVEDLNKIPQLSMEFTDGTEEYFKAKITQATADRPEAYIKVTSPVDMTYVKEYTVRFYGPDTFSNPLMNYGADPYVTYHDGYYYYVRVLNDASLWVSKSAELSRLGKVEPKRVYTPKDGEPGREMWAPEIHFLDGKWYIYYAADFDGNNANHRMYVVESENEDAQSEYTFKGELTPTTNRWAIDQTVLELNGKRYAVWSGWKSTYDDGQRIFIAEMENPWTIKGDRVQLSEAEYEWEWDPDRGIQQVNEGPQVAVAPDGTVNIVYSANGSWGDNYSLGCLTLKDKDADPMDPNSWIKATEPVLRKNNSTTYSTGHASFVPSPDGTQDYLVYHATRKSGNAWSGRGVRTQRVYWNEDGTPFLGVALEYNGKVNTPSGTKKVDYVRYEAEEASTLDGGAHTAETFNSSNGQKVVGLKNANAYAIFDVMADEAGEYRLYVGASTSALNAKLAVSINDGEAKEKTIANFNAANSNETGGDCVDNWYGYEFDVTLEAGLNTVKVSGVTGANEAALDYIELCKLENALAPNPAPGNKDDDSNPPADDTTGGTTGGTTTPPAGGTTGGTTTPPADDTANDKKAEVESVKVENTKVTLGIKEAYTIVPAAVPADAETTYTYKSSDTKVAAVNANGKVTAKKKGNAKITVTAANGKSVVVQVTVKNAPKKITVTKKKVSLKKNKTFTIKYKLPKNTASNKITFKSSNKKVATVDANGKVKALKKGKAKITVSTFNKKKATVTVTVK